MTAKKMWMLTTMSWAYADAQRKDTSNKRRIVNNIHRVRKKRCHYIFLL